VFTFVEAVQSGSEEAVLSANPTGSASTLLSSASMRNAGITGTNYQSAMLDQDAPTLSTYSSSRKATLARKFASSVCQKEELTTGSALQNEEELAGWVRQKEELTTGSVYRLGPSEGGCRPTTLPPCSRSWASSRRPRGSSGRR
jgi:hypothetical protein